MQPGLPGRIIVLRLDRFVVDVREVAAEPVHFLDQAPLRVRH